MVKATPDTDLSDEFKIDPATEKLVIPREEIERQTGRRISPPTEWRWGNRGVNGVRLPRVLCGNRWLTTAAAVAWFIRRQTLSRATPAESKGRSEATSRKLQAAGLL